MKLFRLFSCVVTVACIPSILEAAPVSTPLPYKSMCPGPGAKIPVPWKVKEADLKAEFWADDPHFSADLKSLGVPNAKDPRKKGAYLELRKCHKDSAYSLTPCGKMEAMEDATRRGSGFHLIRRRISGMNIGWRFFWPDDRRYVGLCDGVDFERGTAEAWSICRIWRPVKSRSLGLYVIVPGGAFHAVEVIMKKSEVFLDKKFARCVY